MNEKRGHWYLLTGLVIGLLLGLFYSTVLAPAEFIDVSPDMLHDDLKDEYRGVIALSYQANGDLGRAQARLSLLKDEDAVTAMREQSQRLLKQGGSRLVSQALLSLASAVGDLPQPSPHMQQTPTPTEGTCGKLPVSLPRSVGQVPIFYNQKSSGGRSFIHGDYVSLSTKPLFPFGHGLSYTQFEYSGLTISPACVKSGDEVRISLSISNSGSLPGEEVVQLYVCDEYASVPRPVKELKGFQRISLQPGESRRLTFVLPTSMLAFINTDLELVLEPGDFKVMLGSSSQDIRLEVKFKLEGTVRYINAARTIVCPVEIV